MPIQSPESSIYKLASRLLDVTNRGRARWQPTDRSDAFMYVGSGASVVIATRDKDGVPPHVMTLLDSSGAQVEEVQSDMEWNDQYETHVVMETAWNSLLDHLYAGARRSALNIDTLVQSLLSELEEENEPPF